MSIISNIYIYLWSLILVSHLWQCAHVIMGLKFKGQLTNWPLENQAVELECRQITCSPAEWEVKVKRPSAAYVYKINQILAWTKKWWYHITGSLCPYQAILESQLKIFLTEKKPSYMVDMVGSFFINKLYLLKTGKKALNIYLYLKIFISSF